MLKTSSIQTAINDISNYVVGNEQRIKLALAAILSEGSILIEDAPGSGKTTFAKATALSLGLDFKRIQFTGDLLPSDILGFNIIEENQTRFNPGPIFGNLILADELNRASPKTQSAFMECMEEKAVTIDGKRYELPRPFFVLATQNPSDFSGTSLLPESQLDRFMVSFNMSPLSIEEERAILENQKNIQIQSTQSHYVFEQDQEAVLQIKNNHVTLDYIQNISSFIKNGNFEFRLSTRCLIYLTNLSKAWAYVNGRDFVSPKDVQEILPYVLRHRIQHNSKYQTEVFIQNEIIKKVQVPY